jgi:signal transduction histidine kinase
MQNLIDNAIKYSQHFAEPLVEVGADDHGFFVRDNGIGFDMVNADAIFLPFERLGNASEINGRGMGLANVKRIVERHAGTVCADSEPGKGTTIHFCLGP